jgi:hypothetical protein
VASGLKVIRHWNASKTHFCRLQNLLPNRPPFCSAGSLGSRCAGVLGLVRDFTLAPTLLGDQLELPRLPVREDKTRRTKRNCCRRASSSSFSPSCACADDTHTHHQHHARHLLSPLTSLFEQRLVSRTDRASPSSPTLLSQPAFSLQGCAGPALFCTLQLPFAPHVATANRRRRKRRRRYRLSRSTEQTKDGGAPTNKLQRERTVDEQLLKTCRALARGEGGGGHASSPAQPSLHPQSLHLSLACSRVVGSALLGRDGGQPSWRLGWGLGWVGGVRYGMLSCSMVI